MTTETVVVVLSADNDYARPLATAAHSVIATLPAERQLDLYVLDMGLDADNRSLVERSVADVRTTVHWVDSLRDKVGHLPNTWTEITRATYARLYIPDVLPRDVARAVYLDCDVIARRSVGELFDVDMEGRAAMAVPDVQSPFVTSPLGVPRWFESGRSPGDLNFNCGVMLMDLVAWRQESVRDAALAYLTDGRHYFAQDQEALNVVLAGRIGQLDPRWNQQFELFLREYEVTLPYPRELLTELATNPWITHYSNKKKPWHYGNQHPLVHEWFEHLDQTAFAGWRPAPKKRSE
jgi:lipopolysaccharide biosynthesis glycosyltransferase